LKKPDERNPAGGIIFVFAFRRKQIIAAGMTAVRSAPASAARVTP
jgi:hypothetical protein